MKIMNHRIIYFIQCAHLIVCASLFSQPQEDSDVIELSPFIVTTDKDDRYYASNSISATQLNVPIKDVPFNLEVITSEFMRDTGANDFKESLAFSSGIFTNVHIDNSGAFNQGGGDRSPSSQANVGDRTNNAIVIRGYNAPFQQRMGFRVGSFIGIRGGSTGQGSSGEAGGLTLGSLIDSVNVDRSEIVRGPGALLYGLGVLSGIVNVIPKRPMPEWRTEVGLTVGSDAYYRGTIDTTGPVIRNVLNFRLLGAWQDNEDWTDFFHEERQYQALQLEWKPIKGLNIFGEISRGKLRMEGHQGSRGDGHYIRDNRENGNAFAVNWGTPSVGITEDGRYFISRQFVNEYGENYRWGAEDFLGPYPDVYDASKQAEIWPDGSIRPIEANIGAPLAEPFNRPGFSIYGPDTWYERVEESALLDVDWVVNRNLSFKIGAFFTKQETEERTVHPFIINSTRRNVSIPALIANGQIDREDVFTIGNPIALNQEYVTDYRALAYYWTQYPMDGQSRQFRMSGVYTFETPFFGSDASHSILVGRQDIRDHANIWLTNNDPTEFALYWPSRPVSLGGNELFQDAPLKIRSFYDWTNPLRYNGEEMVVHSGAKNDITTTNWFTGHYAVYSGKFFNDRLTVVGGWRNDRYQAKESLWIHDNRSMERAGLGESYYNFPEAIKEDTLSLGFNYALTDAISLYVVRAEGVIPNTGQRDGDGFAIEPEKTRSLEGGVKFDLLDSKLSGTLSIFKIQRENAIWYYENAPNPGAWTGGRNPFQGGVTADPGERLKENVPISYGFNYHLYFKNLVEGKVAGQDPQHWKDKLGIRQNIFGYTVPNNSPGSVSDGSGGVVYTDAKTPNPGVIVEISRGDQINHDLKDLNPNQIPYVFITYDALINDPELRAIAMQAIDDYRTGNYPDNVDPLGFGNTGASRYSGVNASQRTGANVTFEEEATGVDLQLIYSPTPSLQFIFNVAHVKREAVSAFNMVQAQDYRYPELGNFGTEFDLWVMDFGEEAFGDPTDPTTMREGIKGKSLYYGSENSASIWGRYSFKDGPLEGFGFGLGAIYQGPAQTHVPIGAAGGANRYPTPETEEMLQFRGAIYYEKSFERFDLRIQLNINNLTNKKRLYSEAHYENVDTGEIEKRRTEAFLEPISWRLSCSIIF